MTDDKQNLLANPSSVTFSPHAVPIQTVFDRLQTSDEGLSSAEAEVRLKRYGENILPRAKPPSLTQIFIRQFLSPLIYILLAAAILSLVIQEWSDAIFISIVLFVNALVGTFQEYSAHQAAEALHQLMTTNTKVVRDGLSREVGSQQLVAGDLVFLETGDKVPADIRIIECHDLQVDESLLTGESLPTSKEASNIMHEASALGDRINMLFTGTLIGRGRAKGVVVSTALDTELGKISADVLFTQHPKAPLQVRMDKFTHRVAVFVSLAALLMLAVAVVRGSPFAQMFMLAVALAVSVIPEGLPVALTIALAIGMKRMARRNVIARRLLAVESLGSCTYIASDKTGTLTVNQLTTVCLAIPNGDVWQVSGEGLSDGEITTASGKLSIDENDLFERVCNAALLSNEGSLKRGESGWDYHGDAVDLAFLVMAQKAGISKPETESAFPQIDSIPYESELLFSASLNSVQDKSCAFVKGAFERLLPMCTKMAIPGQEDIAIDREFVEQQAHALASQGYRVLALVAGEVNHEKEFNEQQLTNLTLLGLAGITDPLRAKAKEAVAACQTAGIEVAMVTGDHPLTAFAIAQELGLVDDPKQIVTGLELAQAVKSGTIDEITRRAKVFARVGPDQKLHIVQSLQRNGHFVAVSGDGANDAPALRVAEVGVVMGKAGTDVARDTADLIITDDNFVSIVAGVEEGRVAYANVRKVIFLLISTGAAELVLFTLALLTGLPIPLLAVQLLWLNLVTNGVQHIALAFEPAEGHELQNPPRSPSEPIFNRLMIERVVLSALVIGTVAFLVFQSLIARGFSLDEARNGTLLLMVLFENVHVFNCRSEVRSVFKQNPFNNSLLLIGTLTAQLIHIGAMYTPWISDVLRIQPVSFVHWLELLGMALSIMLAMELYKFHRARR